MLFIPPRSSELNPIEHLWEHLRENHFHNREFKSLDAVEAVLIDALNNLENNVVQSFAGFEWITSLFY